MKLKAISFSFGCSDETAKKAISIDLPNAMTLPAWSTEHTVDTPFSDRFAKVIAPKLCDLGAAGGGN